ncbi:hypothetical protein HY837_00365 [archaeon]|nr:hypothetical protein [archaeon]
MELDDFLQEEQIKGSVMYTFSIYFLKLGSNLTGKGKEVNKKIEAIKKTTTLILNILERQKKRARKIHTSLFNFLKEQESEVTKLFNCLVDFKAEEDYEDISKIDLVRMHIEDYKPLVQKTKELLLALKSQRSVKYPEVA